MKFPIIILTLAMLMGSCAEQEPASETDSGHEHHQVESTQEGTKKPLSPHTSAMANIGTVHVHIDYSSPSVRGRVIWGGLVAYDQIWVAGAHSATWIDFSGDVEVSGNKIPKGKYALFLIPSRDTWQVVLNSNYDQHLTDDYDPALDVLRFEVTPTTTAPKQESLTWKVVPEEDNVGKVSFTWDQVRLSFEIAAT